MGNYLLDCLGTVTSQAVLVGGQAEFVRCPSGDTNLLKIPNSVPDEKALFLSDIIPVSCYAVQCAEVTEGKSVAIWGAGPVNAHSLDIVENADLNI